MKFDKKIVALNLTLVFIFTLLMGVQPAHAEATTPYGILVGGTEFYSNADTAGTGWSYVASSNSLYLNGYSGSSIAAAGNLTIYSQGTVTVTGDASVPYAIGATGILTIHLASGTATLKGADSTPDDGGFGVVAPNVIVYVYGTATLSCIGGNSSASDGGHGIAATDSLNIATNPTANISCTGGTGTTSGGLGIFGKTVTVSANGTITGGSSAGTIGAGIGFAGSLYIGPCTLTVQAGGTSGYAIGATPSATSFNLSPHVTETTTGTYKKEYLPKNYTLTLYGSGGTYNGSATKSITEQAGKLIYLKNYIFTRSDYQQVGWVTGSDFFPFCALYSQTADTGLNASWVDMQANSVLFIGNGGKIGTDYYSKTTTGAAVSIPDSGSTVWSYTTSTNLILLGWSDELSPTVDPLTQVMSTGKWYLPGSTSNITSKTVLYGQYINKNSNVVFYSGNGGTSSTGGDTVIQGKDTLGAARTLIIQDAMGFTRTGYSFDGWKGDPGVSYAAGTALTCASNSSLRTYLTAQWLANYSGTEASVPTVATKNGGSVTLTSNAAITGETLEYAISDTATVPKSGWQTSASFTGLSAGTHYFFARIQAIAGTHAAGTAAVSSAVTVYPTPTISYSSGLLNLAVGTQISNITPTVTTGAGSVSYSILSGTLPAGLSLNTSTGEISGTPTTYNTADGTVTIKITDSETQSATANVAYSAVAKTTATTAALSYDLTAVNYDGKAKAVSVTDKGSIGLGAITVYYNGSTKAPTAAGTYAITVDIAASGNYSAVSGLSLGSFTISKATYDMTSVGLSDSSATYSKTAKDVAVIGALPTGGDSAHVTVAYSYVGTGSTVYATSATAPKDAGTYTVTAKFTGTSNYNSIADKTCTLTIAKKDVTLLWAGVDSRTYNGNASAVTATAESLEAGDICAVTVTGGDKTDAGSYTATATALSNSNYNLPSSATATYMINKADQTALTLSLGTSLLVGNSITATTTGGSGNGAVTYAITSGSSNATLSDASLTGTNSGTVTVTATKAANANYNATTSALVSVTVSPNMTITATNIDKTKITSDSIRAHLKNEGKYTVGAATRKSANLNEFTVAVTGTAALESYASSSSTQGSGKWIGIIFGSVQKNAESALTTDSLWYKSASASSYTKLSDADLTEVKSVGGSDGQFILWLNSETIGSGKTFYLASDSSGSNSVAVTVNFTEYSAPIIGGGGSPTAGTSTSNTVKNPDGSATETKIESVKNSDGSTTSKSTANTTDSKGTVIGSATVASTSVVNSSNQVVASVTSITTTGAPSKITVSATTENGKSTAAEVGIASDALSNVAEKTKSELVVDTDIAEIAFDSETVKTIAEAAAGYEKVGISAGLADTSKLTDKQKSEVGTFPVFDLNVLATNSTGETKRITNFDGVVSVTIPASKLTNQNADNISIYFLADDGTMTKMSGKANADGSYTFTTTHFSYYVAVSENTAGFTDVSLGNWYYNAVNYVVGKNLFKGTSDTAFSPDQSMTRAMLVTVLYRLEGNPPVTGTNTFADVEANQWYTDAVKWANGNGIITGYDATTFGSTDSVTREQLAAILYRYAQYKKADLTVTNDLSAFTDASATSDWALVSSKWAVGNGIITGTTTTNLSPKGDASRAQVATMIMRFCNKVIK